MSDWPYSEDELDGYLADPEKRTPETLIPTARTPRTPVGKYWANKSDDPRKIQAAVVLSYVISFASLLVLSFELLLTTIILRYNYTP